MCMDTLKTQKIENLNLSGNELTARDLLGRTLAENASLKNVDLSWNLFRAKNGVQLLKGLSESVTITYLHRLS